MQQKHRVSKVKHPSRGQDNSIPSSPRPTCQHFLRVSGYNLTSLSEIMLPVACSCTRYVANQWGSWAWEERLVRALLPSGDTHR